MAAINLPFAASGPRRPPNVDELADGYPCGPLDETLDNWLEWWMTGQIGQALADEGIAIQDDSYTQLSTLLQGLGGHGQCQLRYVSATAITLFPKDGNRVRVAGKAVRLPQVGVSIANTGVTINGVAASNLAASTAYLVALGAAGNLEFWTFATGHAKDSTVGNIGVEVIAGHADKTLVGMIRTNAASQFEFTTNSCLVLSWFNRRDIQLQGVTTPGSTTASTTYAILHSPSRVHFLTWGDEASHPRVVGQAHNGTTGFSTSAGVGIDGVFVGIAGASYAAVGGQASYTGGDVGSSGFSEGYHTLDPMGTVGVVGGTGTFTVAAMINVRG